jgi:hypothetical protein
MSMRKITVPGIVHSMSGYLMMRGKKSTRRPETSSTYITAFKQLGRGRFSFALRHLIPGDATDETVLFLSFERACFIGRLGLKQQLAPGLALACSIVELQFDLITDRPVSLRVIVVGDHQESCAVLPRGPFLTVLQFQTEWDIIVCSSEDSEHSERQQPP